MSGGLGRIEAANRPLRELRILCLLCTRSKSRPFAKATSSMGGIVKPSLPPVLLDSFAPFAPLRFTQILLPTLQHHQTNALPRTIHLTRKPIRHIHLPPFRRQKL